MGVFCDYTFSNWEFFKPMIEKDGLLMKGVSQSPGLLTEKPIFFLILISPSLLFPEVFGAFHGGRISCSTPFLTSKKLHLF